MLEQWNLWVKVRKKEMKKQTVTQLQHKANTTNNNCCVENKVKIKEYNYFQSEYFIIQDSKPNL
jgi:hypothetical protein